MGQGQGSISVRQKNEPQLPPGPPFVPASADNGLSVDAVTGRIVLGNDVGDITNPAQLLSNRFIEFGALGITLSDVANLGTVDIKAQSIIMNDGVNTVASFFLPQGFSTSSPDGIASIGAAAGSSGVIDLSVITGMNPARINFIDNLLGQSIESQGGILEVQRYNATNTRQLSLDPVNGAYQLGDINIFSNGNAINIDDAQQFFQYKNGIGRAMMLDIGNQLYRVGDIDGSGNGTLISIDDASETIRMQRAAELMLFLTHRVYSMGNVSDSFLGSKISVDDANESFVFLSVAKGRMMSLQGFNDLYRIGDIDGFGNGAVLALSDVRPSLEYSVGAGRKYLSLDNLLESYQIGDVDGTNNGTKINILDLVSRIEFSNTLRVMNAPAASAAADVPLCRAASGDITQRAGFTGTVTPVVSITVVNGIVTAVL